MKLCDLFEAHHKQHSFKSAERAFKELKKKFPKSHLEVNQINVQDGDVSEIKSLMNDLGFRTHISSYKSNVYVRVLETITRKLPNGLPETIAKAVKASSPGGVNRISVDGDLIKITIYHKNGHMEYHYTLERDGTLRVDWNGYQSPGGTKILVDGDRHAAIDKLAKAIKTQAKFNENQGRYEVYVWE